MITFRPATKPETLHRYLSPKLRFELQVEKRGLDCWPWQGALTKGGYGRLRVNGEQVRAHRFAYEYYKGEIPDGLWVLHHCDNPRCVNPHHLYVGDAQDNADDRVERDRTATGDANASRLYPEKRVRGREHWWAKGNEHYPAGEKNGRAKITEDQVRKIVHLWQTGRYTKTALAEKFPISDVMVGRIVRAEAWQSITKELIDDTL